MTQREWDSRLRRLNGKAIGMSPAVFARRLGVQPAVLDAFKAQLERERNATIATCAEIEAWNLTHPRRNRRGNQ